jgi:hypothetical protein
MSSRELTSQPGRGRPRQGNAAPRIRKTVNPANARSTLRKRLPERRCRYAASGFGFGAGSLMQAELLARSLGQRYAGVRQPAVDHCAPL